MYKLNIVSYLENIYINIIFYINEENNFFERSCEITIILSKKKSLDCVGNRWSFSITLLYLLGYCDKKETRLREHLSFSSLNALRGRVGVIFIIYNGRATFPNGRIHDDYTWDISQNHNILNMTASGSESYIKTIIYIATFDLNIYF